MNLAGYYEIAYSISFFNDAPPISKGNIWRA
jgi:hypothetical protein